MAVRVSLTDKIPRDFLSVPCGGHVLSVTVVAGDVRSQVNRLAISNVVKRVRKAHRSTAKDTGPTSHIYLSTILGPADCAKKEFDNYSTTCKFVTQTCCTIVNVDEHTVSGFDSRAPSLEERGEEDNG
jgi:hypothetical protein